MAKVKISYTAPGADVVTANLDGTPIVFSGTAKAGTAEVTMTSGPHRVRYVVEGLPGTSYTFKIDPPGVSVTDTIGETGTAAGSIPVVIPDAGAAAKAAKGTESETRAKQAPIPKEKGTTRHAGDSARPHKKGGRS